jgi:hypothetical protein
MYDDKPLTIKITNLMNPSKSAMKEDNTKEQEILAIEMFIMGSRATTVLVLDSLHMGVFNHIGNQGW